MRSSLKRVYLHLPWVRNLVPPVVSRAKVGHLKPRGGGLNYAPTVKGSKVRIVKTNYNSFLLSRVTFFEALQRNREIELGQTSLVRDV